MSLTMKSLCRLLRRCTLLIGLSSMAGCATIPVVRVGEGPIPVQLQREEATILDQVRRDVDLLEKKGALYTDPELEKYLQQVGERMVPTNRISSGVRYRFRIVRDPTLNAFASPTGDVFVHIGLLARLQSEEEIAFTLGHEASHVYSRDSLYGNLDLRRKTISLKITDLVLTPALCLVCRRSPLLVSEELKTDRRKYALLHYST